MSKTLLRLSSVTLLLWASGIAAAAGGCGPSQASAICDALCTCTPCTDNDRVDCEDSAHAAETKARVACGAPFDAYFACAEDNIRCHDPSALNTRCEAEIIALIACDSTLPLIGTACEASQTKTQACLGKVGEITTQGRCSGVTACTAQCINAASCAAVKDVYSGPATSAGQPLLDCFNACSTPKGS